MKGKKEGERGHSGDERLLWLLSGYNPGQTLQALVNELHLTNYSEQSYQVFPLAWLEYTYNVQYTAKNICESHTFVTL